MIARLKERPLIGTRGASHIVTSAAVSIAALLAIVGIRLGDSANTAAASEPRIPLQIQEYKKLSDADGNGIADWQDELTRGGFVATTTAATTTIATSSDPLLSLGGNLVRSLLSGYVTLKESGTYTEERGATLAEAIASNLKAPIVFTPYTEEDVRMGKATSQSAILAYRSAMRTALSPVVTNDEPELTLFARFIDTKDPYWLGELSKAAARYNAAESAALKVDVPPAAVIYHVRVLNAMRSFAEVLNSLVRYSSDSIATLALLRTYNEREREMLAAFDALAQFYARSVSH